MIQGPYYWQRNEEGTPFAIDICSRLEPGERGTDDYVLLQLKPFAPNLADRIVAALNDENGRIV